jgi:hypothetical protein
VNPDLHTHWKSFDNSKHFPAKFRIENIISIASPKIIALLRHAKTEETVLRTSSDMSVIVLRDSPDHIARLHLTRATQILANMDNSKHFPAKFRIENIISIASPKLYF